MHSPHISLLRRNDVAPLEILAIRVFKIPVDAVQAAGIA